MVPFLLSAKLAYAPRSSANLGPCRSRLGRPCCWSCHRLIRRLLFAPGPERAVIFQGQTVIIIGANLSPVGFRADTGRGRMTGEISLATCPWSFTPDPKLPSFFKATVAPPSSHLRPIRLRPDAAWDCEMAGCGNTFGGIDAIDRSTPSPKRSVGRQKNSRKPAMTNCGRTLPGGNGFPSKSGGWD